MGTRLLHLALSTVPLAMLALGCAPDAPAEAHEWSALFERSAGFGWSGGDAAYSVPLPGARTLWLFGDSYLSDVKDGQRGSVQLRFGNTIAVQESPGPDTAPSASTMRFDWASADSNGWLPIDRRILEDPMAPPSAAEALARGLPVLSWPLHGIVVGHDAVLFHVPVTSASCEKCGPFSFKVHGSVASIVGGVDRPYEDWGFRSGEGWRDDHAPATEVVPWSRAATRLDDPGGLFWGTFVMPDPDTKDAMYVYGHRQEGGSGTLVVARVPFVTSAGDLLAFSRWQFWDGARFQPDPDRAASIATDSPPEASVVRVPDASGGGYALVQSGAVTDGEIRVSLSPAPTGPFELRYRLLLSDCPVSGFDETAPGPSYAAKAHPELSTEDAILVSVVTMPPPGPSSGTYISNPAQYVPRFIRLPWSEVLSHERSSPERCAA